MTSPLNAYIEQEKKVKKLTEDLKEEKGKLLSLNEVAIDHMLSEGIQSINIDGVTVYMKKDVGASINKENQDEAFRILKELGEGDMIRETIHAGTLKAWVNEFISARDEALKEDDEQRADDVYLPKEIRNLISVYEGHKAAVRGLTKK